MHKIKQGIRSTIARVDAGVLTPETKVHGVHSKVIDLSALMCTNETCRFPVRSTSYNNFIMVICDYDANTMTREAMPDRKRTTLQKSFLVLHNKLRKKGNKPKMCRLDNEMLADERAKRLTFIIYDYGHSSVLQSCR